MKKVVIAFIAAIILIAFIYFMNRPGAIAVPSSVSYIADKKCYACHKPQAKVHVETLHPKSFDCLIDTGEEKNPKCLPCHTTGYGKPGGFVEAKATPDMVGVGCQACHGPGSMHVEHGLSKDLRRQTIDRNPKDACAKCHEIHKNHLDMGAKAIPSLRKKIDLLQNQIQKLGGK